MLFILAAEEHEENGWLLPADINEVIWGSIAFAIVLGLFLWKGLPLVKRAMQGRSERIAAELAAAEQARKDAEAELAAVRADLANADVEAERIVADAKARAEQLKADLIARAEAEVAEAAQRARIEIEASKEHALADLRAEIAARALRAAEAVVSANLDQSTHSQLIDRYIEQVGS